MVELDGIPQEAAQQRRAIASPIELASDRGRAGLRAGAGRAEATLGPAERERVEAAARDLGAAASELALAAFASVLHRRTQQSELVIGAWARAGESRRLGSVPLAFDDALTFAQVVEGVRRPAGGAAAWVEGAAFPSHALFAPDAAAAPPGPPVPPDGVCLTVDGPVLRLAYDAAAFRSERMDELMEQVRTFLEQASRDPAVAVLDPSLVTERGRALLPDPAVALEQPRYPLLTEAFEACVERDSGGIAVRQAGRTWTYRQLGDASGALAALLVARGVRPGEVVAVTGQRSFAVVSAMLAVFRSGGVLLTVDPRLPAERQRVMVEQAGARLLVCASDPGPLAAAQLEVIAVDPDTGRVATGAGAPAASLPALDPEWPAYVFFTSGSTGVPKAVCGRHAGLAHFLDWQRRTFGIGPGDRASQLTALSFDVVLRDMFLALTSGAELCIPTEGDVLDPERILRWLAQERITVLHVVPSLMRLWLNNVPDGLRLAELRRAFFAGEPLTDVLVARFRETLAPQAMVINLYGPTETTLAKCSQVVEQTDPGIQPIGRPQPQTQVLILNRRRRRCGLDEVGEIAIRTPFRTLGYLNDPAASARAFIPNPFAADPADPADLVYLTGDSGRYRTDGILEILGRIDNQVKIRGMRVEPGEIEAVLGRHPAVREAVVAAREDPAGGKVLVAYVVRRDADGEGAGWVAAMREFLRERLPEHMVPAAFVALDALPLNPNGKVNKKALPAPDRAAWGSAAYTPPADDLEAQLAAVWRDVLQLDRVGVEDGFFDVGGHSLLAVQLAVDISTRLGRPCPVPLIFEAPTVRRLANRLRNVAEPGGERRASLVPLRSTGSGPQLYCICGVWLYQGLADALGSDFRTYGIFLPVEQEIFDDPGRIQTTTVEEMASAYLQVIRAHQPHGPYALSGVSFGGVLAYEMAQQLVRAGERVELLAMLDSMLPGALRRGGLRRLAERLRRPRSLWNGLRRRLARMTGRGRDDTPGEPSDPAGERTRRMEELRDALYREATRRYRPQPFAGRALLVRAMDKSFFDAEIADPSYGWGALVPLLDMIDVPGDHIGILRQPSVALLAERFRAILGPPDRQRGDPSPRVAAPSA